MFDICLFCLIFGCASSNGIEEPNSIWAKGGVPRETWAQTTVFTDREILAEGEVPAEEAEGVFQPSLEYSDGSTMLTWAPDLSRLDSGSQGNATAMLARATDPCQRHGLQSTSWPYTAQKSVAACSSCVQDGSCEWCPVKQICVHDRYWSTTCKGWPVKTDQDCQVLAVDANAGHWLTDIPARYKEDEFRSKQIDAKRCMEWSLDWTVSKDSKQQDLSDEDVGMWACVSALTREAFEVAMGAEVPRGSRASEASYSSTGVGPGEQDTGENAWSVVEWEPVLCEVINVKYGKPCSVRVYAKEDFQQLRSRSASPDHAGPGDITPHVLTSMQSGPLISFSPGAGKSGSGFAKASDDAYYVKVGLKQNSKMAEVNNLRRLIKGLLNEPRAIPLAQHLHKHPKSLLNRYYGAARIGFGSFKQFGLLMEDATWREGEKVEAAQTRDHSVQYQRYDLKGKSRDITEEKKSGFTLINGDFTKKENGVMEVRNWMCREFISSIRADSDYLAAHNMIDYSVFLTVAKVAEGKQSSFCQGLFGVPWCFDWGNRAYTISIIDYLNDLNWFKSLESNIKLGKFSNYNGKIQEFAVGICPTNRKEPWTWGEIFIVLLIIALIVAIFGLGVYVASKPEYLDRLGLSRFFARTPQLPAGADMSVPPNSKPAESGIEMGNVRRPAGALEGGPGAFAPAMAPPKAAAPWGGFAAGSPGGWAGPAPGPLPVAQPLRGPNPVRPPPMQPGYGPRW